MAAQCPVCAKANTAGRFMSTRIDAMFVPITSSTQCDAKCGHACHATVAAKDYIFQGVSEEVNASIPATRSEEHTSELQSLRHLVCRLLLEKKKKKDTINVNAL